MSMQLTIRHETTYVYDTPVVHGLQRLRLTPPTSTTQQVGGWTTEVEGGHKQVSYLDHFGNFTELVSIDPGVSTLRVMASGQVQTMDTGGVVSNLAGLAPLWLFQRSTPLTTAGPAVAELIGGLDDDPVPLVHELSSRIASTVTYQSGHTTATATAEDALAAGYGVCQDHSHVFLAAARKLGFPARYVSGYLFMDDTDDQDASHAWVEVWIDALGWVGLDPSNGISPDDRYVRIATGLDYQNASPISGIRFGAGQEHLEVTLQIQQQ